MEIQKQSETGERMQTKKVGLRAYSELPSKEVCVLPFMEEWDFPLPIPQRAPLSSWTERARKVKVNAKEVI